MSRQKSVDDSSCLTKIILNSEISDLNIVMARLKTILIFFSGPVLNLIDDALRVPVCKTLLKKFFIFWGAATKLKKKAKENFSTFFIVKKICFTSFEKYNLYFNIRMQIYLFVYLQNS